MNSPKITILLIIAIIIAAIIMWNTEPVTLSERELIQFCDADYCTTAAGAFWAKQDSLDAARFFGDASDEALPPQEGF